MNPGPYKAGGGLFGPDHFTVQANNGDAVPAKYLVDSNGYYVMDPNTGAPLIVPEDYDPSALYDRYAQYAAYASDPSGGTAGDPNLILAG